MIAVSLEMSDEPKIVNVIDDTVQYGLSSYDYICSKYGLVYKVAI